MPFSLNKLILIGNLGKDCEVRSTTAGKAVTTFSLVTNYSFKSHDGKWEDQPTWHNCVVWDASDFVNSNLKAGRKFYIEGRLVKRNYENKDGQKVYVTEVVVDKYNIIPLTKDAGLDTVSSDDLIDLDDPDLPF